MVVDDELEIPLEAAGLSIFGRNHLSLDWEAQRLIAHEFSHQWWGNSLTLKRWTDIWLHEGFACFSEWLYSESAGLLSLADRARAAWEKLEQSAQDLVIGAPGPELMFDDRVYKRGALALFALLGEVGAEAFYAMLKEWVATHAHGHVDTAAFLAHAQGFAPGTLDVAALLEPWLYEQALPAFPR